jgi:hypothetical protein
MDGSDQLLVADGQLAAIECGRPAGLRSRLQGRLVRGESPSDRNRGILAGPDLTGHSVTTVDPALTSQPTIGLQPTAAGAILILRATVGYSF